MAKKDEKWFEPDEGTFEAMQVTLGLVMKAMEDLSRDVSRLQGKVSGLEKRLKNVEIRMDHSGDAP